MLLSLANSNFPSNITLALYHGKNAVELLDDVYRLDDEIIDDTDFVRKYNELKIVRMQLFKRWLLQIS